jgi:MFS family permease
MLSPLQHRAFAVLWIANLVSNIGGVVQSVGASWLMTSLDPSPHMVALVQTAAVSPIMILSVLGGALADIYNRRTVMLTAQIFMAIASAALAIIGFLSPIDPWHLLVFTFLIGAGGAIHAPTWQSSISDQVPREELSGAVSLNAFGFNVARSVAPAIGGAVIAFAGAPAAFALNAVSYLGLIAALFRWNPKIPKATLPHEPLHRAIGGGLRYISMSPTIIAIMARALMYGFCGGALWALLPLVAHDLLRGGPLTYGALFGLFGIGAMSGALLNVRLRVQIKNDSIVNFGTAAFGLASIVAGFSPWVFLTLPVMCIAGASWVITLSTFNVSVQMSSPRWVAGRTISVYQVAVFGGLATGSAVWGFVAGRFGLAETLIGAGVLMLLTLLTAPHLKMPSVEGLALDPWTRQTFNEPVLEMHPRSGPIAVMIEYEVDPAESQDFLVAMQEMGRIRRRDGARRWTLTQDIDHPALWVEHYHSPTWLDHQHRQMRPTIADEAARERVLRFQKPGSRPVVHRLLERPSPHALREASLARHDPLHDSAPEH